MVKGWLKVKTAAEWADVSPKTVRAWLGQGLRHSRVGGIILIRREHLNEWLEGFTVEDQSDIDGLVDEVMEKLCG